jgi:hypothetical protein
MSTYRVRYEKKLTMNYSARDAGVYKRSELLSILVLTGFQQERIGA